ncbi:serine protease [Vibrio sp.]|nr:serine protease [Vibrio sp.]
MVRFIRYLISLLCFFSVYTFAALPDTIASIKPSVVGVGTYNRLAEPNTRFLGTGFAVLNGTYIATNAHVIPDYLDTQKKEKLIVFVGSGKRTQVKTAEVVKLDAGNDLAILKIIGSALPPLVLTTRKVREGEAIAFTGFPIGAILGLYPVTHTGIISSITPIVIPARTARELTAKQLKQLRNPFMVYQLDATAYPGNSGSPVYDQNTGEVIAIVNKVLVKSTKESVLSDPSAITYAIPVKHLINLLNTIK